MLTAERTRPGAAVETVIHYVDPAAPIGAHHDTDPSRSTLALNAHVVQVQDARPLADSLDLETNGFIFVRSPTAVTNFENREQREGAYYAEARELVRALTGAEEVLVFGDGVRNGAPDAPAGTRAPVFNAQKGTVPLRRGPSIGTMVASRGKPCQPQPAANPAGGITAPWSAAG